jgi:hypothetical protein
MNNQKKLVLKRTTIQSFIVPLDRNGQQEIKGGVVDTTAPTAVPIFCAAPANSNG